MSLWVFKFGFHFPTALPWKLEDSNVTQYPATMNEATCCTYAPELREGRERQHTAAHWPGPPRRRTSAAASGELPQRRRGAPGAAVSATTLPSPVRLRLLRPPALMLCLESPLCVPPSANLSNVSTSQSLLLRRACSEPLPLRVHRGRGGSPCPEPPTTQTLSHSSVIIALSYPADHKPMKTRTLTYSFFCINNGKHSV